MFNRCKHTRIHLHSIEQYINCTTVVGFCRGCGKERRFQLPRVHGANNSDNQRAQTQLLDQMLAKGWRLDRDRTEGSGINFVRADKTPCSHCRGTGVEPQHTTTATTGRN